MANSQTSSRLQRLLTPSALTPSFPMDSTTIFLVFILILCALVILAVFVTQASQIVSLFFGAPFVPTQRKTVATMIKIANITKDDIVVDLGSGDGRVTIAAAEAGARRALGFEIQPHLVWYARAVARRKGLGGRVVFINGSFWKAEFSSVTVVFIYQLSGIMKKLEQKLLRELPSGARVVSNSFVFKEWQPEKTEEHVILYRKP